MASFLTGAGARFYRGIGSEIQLAGPFAELNFFIGSNNSGKSVFLNLISGQIAKSNHEGRIARLEDTEVFRGGTSGPFELFSGCRANEVYEQFNLKYGNRLKNISSQGYSERLIYDVKTIIEKMSLNGMLWLSATDNGLEPYPRIDPEDAKDWQVDWNHIWSAVTGKGRGSASAHWIPETINIIVSVAKPTLPSVHLIPAKRSLGQHGEMFTDLSGKGLIDHLATLQNPAWNEQENREAFARINMFLQEVTGKSDAILEVPSDRQHLLVHMDSKVLPLESLGTGIHEVILIAAFCTIHADCIMCIEEPEIHLHPLLQRKLIRYLQTNTSNQYFIATHSAVFIDTPDSNVFHVSNDGDQTRVRAALTDQLKREVLDDLGYQASDLLQTNAVIWVEGPSDRIYLNHWIEAIAPELHESIHYTIMFYGGSLVRHLSASDVALEKFIALRKLNRNMAIVFDSDKSGPDDELKPHVVRIVAEMDDGDGVVWVTHGREIENYVDGELLQAAMKSVHPRLYVKAGNTGPFDHAFYFFREDPKRPGQNKTFKDGDKVGAANLVCSEEANLHRLDLEERVLEIVQLVKRANGLLVND